MWFCNSSIMQNYLALRMCNYTGNRICISITMFQIQMKLLRHCSSLHSGKQLILTYVWHFSKKWCCIDTNIFKPEENCMFHLQIHLTNLQPLQIQLSSVTVCVNYISNPASTQCGLNIESTLQSLTILIQHCKHCVHAGIPSANYNNLRIYVIYLIIYVQILSCLQIKR